MDGRLCLCSASVVLLLVLGLGGCFARPGWQLTEDPEDREKRDEGGALRQELQMLKRMLEREDPERQLEVRKEEREQMEREQMEREHMEREHMEREHMERGQREWEQMETEETEMERIERLLEEEREQRRQTRRKVHAHQFLERFGYLPILQKNVSHDPSNVKRAIREMQRMYHLNTTGELDEITIEMMQVPRCGMRDATPKEYLNILSTGSHSLKDFQTELIANNYYVPGYKWKKLHLSWRLKNFHQLLSPEVTKNALRSAFKFWSDVSALKFTETDSDKADINMEFVWGSHQDGPGNAFDGSGGVLAHAFYPESGETHFDEEEYWTDGTNEGINLMIVATHELGHALGIGHSNVQGALMAPYYQGYDPNFKLPYDDVRAIQTLYGGPVAAEPSQSTPAPVPTSVKPTTERSNPNPPSGGPPNICEVVYKAITQTHDYRIYVYNGRWMWRTSEYGLDQGFPLTISTYYETPPDNITAAVFSWKTSYTYFFKGRKVWRYYGFQLADVKTIATSGYPENPKAAIASKDNTLLLIKAGNVWKFDEDSLDVMDASNPTPFDSVFPGAPKAFDSAVRLVNDPNIYFFKGLNYYKYSEDARETVEGYPKEKAGPWMGPACGAKPYTPK